MPGSPAASRTAAAESARPTHIVDTGERMKRIVSWMANSAGHVAAWAVDVEVDRLVGVLALEEQELGDHEVGRVVVDLGAEEHDAVSEQPRPDVVGTLAASAGLDDGGYEHGSSSRLRN